MTVSQKFPYKSPNVTAVDGTTVWTGTVAQTVIEKSRRKEIAFKNAGHKILCLFSCLGKQKKVKTVYHLCWC